MTRYARQVQLPQVGAEGQARLAAAHVLVIGAGGLAAPALSYLAGAGVGRITVMDADRVSLSNLHRQTLFTMDDIGAPKAEAAAARLRAQNPEVTITALCEAFTPANGAARLAGVDLALDCADSYAASYTASDLCGPVPLITASVLGASGYVAGCCGGAPSLRALFPDPPDSAASCATAGVFGPVVGALGALQAQMALGALLGLKPSSLGQAITLNTATWRMASFRFDAAPEPDRALRFIATSQITETDAVYDLRPESEARHTVGQGAIRLPDTCPTQIRPAKRVVLACSSGLRAWRLGTALGPDFPGEIVLVADPQQETTP
ncbi:ThiF family adenylyltransferase [Dinoroseobacter sp. PD6]|uniref:HesA/MoeB/ThiF family protein n=1 Tax=Dinoroseobacter sp. PD6 TaxID=3028384 RepID=UPI00237A1BC8|nr:ThiF family adenylyltransferase [Dinoroseobacter sp. PD6]MDD9718389.1 ThiF family adenylyltransferase [Dinoroseobacter sp. PD6]